MGLRLLQHFHRCRGAASSRLLPCHLCSLLHHHRCHYHRPASPAVYRSNWLGAQGHEERKKLAEAEARLAAERQHANQRGQMP